MQIISATTNFDYKSVIMAIIVMIVDWLIGDYANFSINYELLYYEVYLWSSY